MTDQETFTTRLRRHRQRSRISLAEIATTSRVKEELLEGLERNDLNGWPKGLYARAYVRAYAAAVGLDEDDTVGEFCRLFPQGDRRAGETMREMAAIIATDSEWHDETEYAGRQDRRRSVDINLLPKRRGVDAAIARVSEGIAVLTARVSASFRRNARTFNPTGR